MGFLGKLFGRAGKHSKRLPPVKAKLAADMQALVDAGKVLMEVKSASGLAEACQRAATLLATRGEFEPLVSALRGISRDAGRYSDAEAKSTAMQIASKLTDALDVMRKVMDSI